MIRNGILIRGTHELSDPKFMCFLFFGDYAMNQDITLAVSTPQGCGVDDAATACLPSEAKDFLQGKIVEKYIGDLHPGTIVRGTAVGVICAQYGDVIDPEGRYMGICNTNMH